MNTIKTRETLPQQMRQNYVRRPFYNAVRNEECWCKPHFGTGMWTSTYQPEAEWPCDWVRWMMTEEFWSGLSRWRYGYIYEVRKGLRIAEIESQEDLHAITRGNYGFVDPISQACNAKSPSHPIHYQIDFQKMARDFDAIHLTDAGQWDTRLPHSGDNLYGWDAESTLWLRLHKNSLRIVKKIKLNLAPRMKRHEVLWKFQSQRLRMDAMMRDMPTNLAAMRVELGITE